MKTKQLQKIIGAMLIVLVLSTSLAQPVSARNFFQRLGHGLKKGITFVVKLPDKSTRWMGPVLGPIASGILTHNLSTHSRLANVFNKARRAHNIIENVEQQKQLLRELKSAYAEQAQDLSKIADGLRQKRKDLASQLVKGELDYDSYMEQAINLEKIAQTYDAAADDFRHKSTTVTEKTVINMVLKNATNTLISRIKQATAHELENEVNRLVKTDVIDRLLGDSRGSTVLDMLIEREVAAFFGEDSKSDIDSEEFADRLRDRIKQLIKDSKDDLRLNWNQRMQEAMQELAQEMQADAEKMTNSEPTIPQKPPEKVEIPVDADGCKPGYTWNIKVGDCIQVNCNEIPDAHYSYVLDCVCGSSGSINENPDDPNKECSYSLNYASCPGCVYACVHSDDDCPLDGIGGY